MPTILITGANRGIGLELAKQYGNAGWHVIACCRKPNNSQELLGLQVAFGKDRLSLAALEVTNEAQIQKLATELRNTPIDILFNNAGVYGPKKSTFGTVEPKEWLEVLRVNTIAPFMVAQAFIKHVAASKLKIIANMSSAMGSIELNNDGDHYVYRSSKAGLNAVTKSMAIDLKPHGISVVAFHPGWVQTDMGGPQAHITPQQSVQGIRNILENLTLEDSGNFIRFDGDAIPW